MTDNNNDINMGFEYWITSGEPIQGTIMGMKVRVK